MTSQERFAVNYQVEHLESCADTEQAIQLTAIIASAKLRKIVSQRCPYKALKIINLPKDMSKEITHRYGKNAFKLHRLPTPRPG